VPFQLNIHLRREKNFEEDVQNPAKFVMDVLLVVFSKKDSKI
jgi:hypothetical protein